MKHVLLTLTLFVSFFASAQIVNIPDANFKNALLNHNPVIDTNGDGEIQVSEAEAVTEYLNVYQKEISDMTGIEVFVNLQELSCDRNEITELDISQNINLKKLYCNYNDLSELDISNNTNLEVLQCVANNLSSLDTSQNLMIWHMYLASNNLTTIDLSQNANLQSFLAAGNSLTSLDVSQNSELQNLQINGNDITSLDVTSNQNLITLSVYSNNIGSLDITQNPNLEGLFVSQCGLSNLDVSQNFNLINLQCSNNNINSLDVTENTLLENLSIGGNQIVNIDLSQNVLLEIFSYNFGPISFLDISQNINLLDVSLINTQINNVDFSNSPNLCRLNMNNNFLLEYINLKNGNNEILVGGCANPLSLLNNPNLQFICVEDAQYAATNFTDIPPLATFVEDCSIANGDLNHITGTVKYDDENNGCDGGDVGIGGLLVNTTDGTNNFATTTISTGDYNLTVAENIYTTTVLGLSPYFTLTPAQEVDTFVGFNQTEIADFCIAPTTTANDLAVTLVPLNAARPGFEARYKLVYENVGTTELSGNVELDFDGTLVTFVEATPTETSINGNTISWDYSNLNPFETRSIEVIFEVAQPPIVEAGDVLPYTATINPVSGDAAPDDNVFELNQIVVNSYDPNDKQVLEGYQVLIEDVDEYLHYVIRFQNMGTASAINVRVQDALDEKLDWTTFKVLDASHAMETQLVNGSIDFIFDNINLPTATSDPEGSQGFVAFKVKPVSTVQLNDVVANAADIYFDFNAAIVTNTVFTKFVDVLGVTDFDTLNVVAYPNPANNILNIQADGSVSSIEIMNVLGQTLLTSKGNSNREQIDISGLSAGNYFVRVVVGDGSRVLRVVKK
ncbi:T9SS type A sorting domain-containing protein [Aequorivita nionensis]|uniref:DUF7619 domain-containing protein n=1 Tax=Aequorivita nionensis TaxID=1287690 RepID=UPI003965A7B7